MTTGASQSQSSLDFDQVRLMIEMDSHEVDPALKQPLTVTF
jgi:hypothetical protein